MSIQSRCPSCRATLAPSATWCSLCHADLRPAPAPLVDPSPVLADPDSSAADSPRPQPPSAASSRPPRGRHVRQEGAPEPAAAPPGLGGRHRRGVVALLDGHDVGTPETPEDVSAYADLMLTRLALSDTGPQLADPSRFPGGRWGLAGAATLVLTVVLLGGTAVVGALLG